MSHTSEAFKKGKAMIAFLTAGVPSMEDTVKYVLDLEKAGVDLIEIGVPFSDPFADGGVMKVLNSDRAQAFRRQWQKNKAPGFCHNCQFVDF